MATDQQHRIDYTQITESIFIGTNACCQTHFNEVLTKNGITADISLEQERLDAAQGAEVFLWLPTLDHTPISHDKLAIGIETLRSIEAQGKKIYVHCKNGHGRSPMLVAAYLMKSRGIDTEQAIAFIKAKRPSIHLDPDQITGLEKLP